MPTDYNMRAQEFVNKLRELGAESVAELIAQEAVSAKVAHFTSAIPGTLQTEEVVRSILQKPPHSDKESRELQVEARLFRQQCALQNKPHFNTVIEENALTRGYGLSKEAHIAQLEAIVASPLSFRIIPRTEYNYRFAVGAFLVFYGENDNLLALYRESGRVLQAQQDPAHVAAFESYFKVAEQAALDEQASRDLIRGLIQEMQ